MHISWHILSGDQQQGTGERREIFLTGVLLILIMAVIMVFFESAMAQAESPADALIKICEASGRTPHDKTNCYHGGGHGIMMDASYHLKEALAVCQSVPRDAASDCVTGVFYGKCFGFCWQKNI